MTALVLDGVSHTYRGGRDALRGVSLRFGVGVTALVGVNGAGKSTLLTIAAGGLRPGQGTVTIAGRDPYRGRARRSALREVGLMPQVSTFPRSMTAREVVEYLAWMRGSSQREARGQATRALADVGLADRAGTPFGALSGGMQRRVCLAQAIATRPAVLLLDEPSTGLDPQQRQLMVERLRQVGGAVVLSSHVMEDVVDLADRVVVLDQGVVAFSGAVDELVARAPDPSSPRAAEAGFLAVIGAAAGAA